jgi:hypothetical protein
VANTGLLGINPFQKGVNIDISSKPTNLAIQGIQKDAAKREALDKYFMDYEKSINPAGMRDQEQNIFLQKLNQNKQYYLQNRDKILNPAKYGADAQSQYTANFKDMLNLIDQSKTAAAHDKVFMQYLNQAHTAGKRTSDNALDMLKQSKNPIGYGYQAPDPSLVEIYNPHDEKRFIDNAWTGNPLEKNTTMEPEVINGKKTGKLIPVISEVMTPQAVKSAATSVSSMYDTDHGTREHFDKLLGDSEFVSQVAPLYKQWYNRDIADGKDLAVAYALAQKQGGVLSRGASKWDVDPWEMARYKSNLTQARTAANKKAEPEGDPIQDYIDNSRSGKTFEGPEGANMEKLNLPQTIVDEFKTKDYRSPVLGRATGDGQVYLIHFQKDNQGKETSLIDWTKTVVAPSMQVRNTVVKHALPSSTKVKLTQEKSSGKKDINGF